MIDGKAFTDVVMLARRNSIFLPENHMFLLANAHAYGYEVTDKGVIVDKEGTPLAQTHEDYETIIMKAKKQVVSSSSIGADLIGN
tara:strand:+ start:511 stop:765 length:255 start_codon:yes stop_codon:yes gene_type:complete